MALGAATVIRVGLSHGTTASLQPIVENLERCGIVHCCLAARLSLQHQDGKYRPTPQIHTFGPLSGPPHLLRTERGTRHHQNHAARGGSLWEGEKVLLGFLLVTVAPAERTIFRLARARPFEGHCTGPFLDILSKSFPTRPALSVVSARNGIDGR